MTTAFARVRTSWIGAGAALAVLVLDILTKGWAVSALSDGRDIHIIWTLHFALIHNEGMAFSTGTNVGPFIGMLAIVVIGVLLLTNIRRIRIVLIETIPAALHEQRLDRVVALIADISRASTATLIELGGVTLDGVAGVAGKVKVKEGQEVTINTSMIPEKELPQGDASVVLDVVYADDDVIVVNKAPGIVVHPGAGNPNGTLVNGILALYPEVASVGDQLRPGVVHRLDAGTSGLMVVARSQVAYDSLVDALTRRDVTRVYVALVWGHPEVATGLIDAPIGRDQRDPTKMAVVIDGKFARTHYDVLKKFEQPQPCSLVECQLETGRTHQIRVHLDSIGHPVVGDSTYGGARSSLSSPRPMLHAAKLSFAHPTTGEVMTFEAPVPEDMQAVVNRCE